MIAVLPDAFSPTITFKPFCNEMERVLETLYTLQFGVLEDTFRISFHAFSPGAPMILVDMLIRISR